MSWRSHPSAIHWVNPQPAVTSFPLTGPESTELDFRIADGCRCDRGAFPRRGQGSQDNGSGDEGDRRRDDHAGVEGIGEGAGRSLEHGAALFPAELGADASGGADRLLAL